MKKSRNYMAYCDDGHDFFEIHYTSEHRAGSKANEVDARREYLRKHSKKHFRIVHVQKEEE